MEMISGHYKTGQTLPVAIFQQVCKGSKNRVKLQLGTSNFYTVLYLKKKNLEQELRTRNLIWVEQGCRRGERVRLPQTRLLSVLRENWECRTILKWTASPTQKSAMLKKTSKKKGFEYSFWRQNSPTLSAHKMRKFYPSNLKLRNPAHERVNCITAYKKFSIKGTLMCC